MRLIIRQLTDGTFMAYLDDTEDVIAIGTSRDEAIEILKRTLIKLIEAL